MVSCRLSAVDDSRKRHRRRKECSGGGVYWVPLQPSSGVAIDDGDGLRIGNGDVIGLYAHEGAKPLMGLVNG